MTSIITIEPNYAQSAAARANLSGLVEAYAARGGAVRRFNDGDSGVYMHVQNFLAARGLILKGAGKVNLFTVSKPGARSVGKHLSWVTVIRMVDEIRSSEGLEPLRKVLS